MDINKIITIKKMIYDIVANAVWGESNSFMPSGLVQWITLVVLVLLGVILVRKILSIDKRYFKKPMKHD
jgi:hypothetical protein